VAEETGRGPLSTVRRHTLIYGSGYVATAAVSLVLVPVFARLKLRVSRVGVQSRDAQRHSRRAGTAAPQPSSTTWRGGGR
jgi:hypothetical protein